MLTFLKQVRTELLQVTWPTRAEITRLTFVVIVISVLVGVYLGFADYLFTLILEWIVS